MADVRSRLSLRWILIAIAAALVAAGFALDATAPEAEQLAAVGDAAAVREVGALTVTPTSLRARAEVAGVLEPRRTVLLFAETRGPVTAIGAEALDSIPAGHVLVEIDPLLAEVAVERATAAVVRRESELALAQSNLGRRSSLADRGAASASALDNAQNADRVARAALREARAELKSARNDLVKKTIRAPFDGFLRSFDVEVGEYVQVGQQLGELLDGSSARVTIGVSDRDVVALRPGQPASVAVEAFPGEVFEGEVIHVGAASTRLTKKFPVEVEIPNENGRLLAGMIATVMLDLHEPMDRILIPRDATIDQFGLRYVYVIEAEGDDYVVRRSRIGVRPVPFLPAVFEVTTGLDSGDRIAVTAIRQLKDRDRVRFRDSATR
jgi:membrane fusion protein (multidrug efflux system)